MHILEEKLRAPELRVTQWLNSSPLSLADLRGKLVLIDFWDYTCINCLHTLPYLQAWHERYYHAGLVIIGIHAPEFQFAHQPSLVETAVQRLKILYPVALDNQFQTWNAFANRAWPAKYLIDGQGYLRAFHHGEGAYVEFEHLLQKLLLEMEPHQNFPNPLPPLHDFDQPGTLCLRPTPELYCGWGRAELGNSSNRLEDTTQAYTLPATLKTHTVYLEGLWHQRKEYIEVVESPALLHLQYQARQVNVVIEPPIAGNPDISLLLDGQPIAMDSRGQDIQLHQNKPVLSPAEPRMLELISHPAFEQHQLTLELMTPGVRIYAFTFVGCPASA